MVKTDEIGQNRKIKLKPVKKTLTSKLKKWLDEDLNENIEGLNDILPISKTKLRN